MRVIGWIAFVVGGLALLLSLGMDTTVPTMSGSRVHNIGLLNEQRNLLTVGGLGAVCGIFLLAISGRRAKGTIEAVTQDSRPARDCPFCAERILAAAKVCRFCGREVDPSTEQAGRKAPSPDPTAEELAALGISFDGSHYRFQSYRYERAQDAVAYAKRQT